MMPVPWQVMLGSWQLYPGSLQHGSRQHQVSPLYGEEGESSGGSTEVWVHHHPSQYGEGWEIGAGREGTDPVYCWEVTEVHLEVEEVLYREVGPQDWDDGGPWVGEVPCRLEGGWVHLHHGHNRTLHFYLEKGR